MNNTTQWKVDEHITEMLKLLIWSENTYKRKKKKRCVRGVGVGGGRGKGRVELGIRRGMEDERKRHKD
jgi:hypothetical protein